MKYSHLTDRIIQTNPRTSAGRQVQSACLSVRFCNMSVHTNYRAVCSSMPQRNVINHGEYLDLWSNANNMVDTPPRSAWLLQGCVGWDLHDEDRPSQRDTAAGNSKLLQAIQY